MIIAASKLVVKAFGASISTRVLSSPSAIKMKMSPAYLTSIQVSTASVSFVSSLLMATSISYFGSEGLSTPYRRIILALSISDILQSFALLTGPSMVPEIKMSLEAANEVASCQINAFLLQLGGGALAMYTFLLCLYYLCKLKYRMTDGTFKQKIELKFHAFIIVSLFAANIAALVLDAYHTNTDYLSFCTIAPVPTRCWNDPDLYGECDATILKRTNFMHYLLLIMLIAIFFGIVVTMALLFHHAIESHQSIKREVSFPTALRGASNSKEEEGGDKSRSQDHHDNDEESKEEEGEEEEEEEEHQTPQDRLQQISRLYKRECIIQASLYVGAYTITYIPMAISYQLKDKHSFLPALVIFFFPLGGFLNILIYTRPKVAILRSRHPECSRIRGFWVVLREGGEIPDNVDPCCHDCCSKPALTESEYEYTETSNGRQEGRNERSQSYLSFFGCYRY